MLHLSWRRLCRLKRRRRTTLIALVVGLFGLYCLSTLVGLHELLLQRPFSQFRYPLEVDLPSVVRAAQKGGMAAAAKHLFRVRPVNSPAQFRYIHPANSKCVSPGSTARPLDAVFLVKSAIEHRWHRHVLRHTWMNETLVAGKRVRAVFLLGAPANDAKLQSSIDTEQRVYGDIVQQNFHDTYYNNTYKLMLGFQWIRQHCLNARHYLFADDDYLVNPWQLHGFLASLPPLQRSRLLVGYVFTDSIPKRFFHSKWYISLTEYPYARWPPYPAAGAFVVSRDLVEDLGIGMLYTKLLRFDDVFLGIVAHKLGVRPLHSDRFPYSRMWPWLFNLLGYSQRDQVAQHMEGQADEVLREWLHLGFAVNSRLFPLR